MTDGPTCFETKGTYKGPIPTLKGERAALLIYPGSPRCLATFEVAATGYSAGYHDFDPAHFDLDQEPPHGA